MNLPIRLKLGNYIGSWATIDYCSIRTLLAGFVWQFTLAIITCHISQDCHEASRFHSIDTRCQWSASRSGCFNNRGLWWIMHSSIRDWFCGPEICILSERMYSCLRFAGSNPAESDGLLRAIKICSTISFGEKWIRRPRVVRFYGMLKIPGGMIEILLVKISFRFSPSLSPLR
jgi:hypothetical protein